MFSCVNKHQEAISEISTIFFFLIAQDAWTKATSVQLRNDQKAVSSCQ